MPWEPLDKYELIDNMHMLDQQELDQLHSPAVDADVNRAALNEKIARSYEPPLDNSSTSSTVGGNDILGAISNSKIKGDKIYPLSGDDDSFPIAVIEDDEIYRFFGDDNSLPIAVIKDDKIYRFFGHKSDDSLPIAVIKDGMITPWDYDS
jgi:hypothetical protein